MSSPLGLQRLQDSLRLCAVMQHLFWHSLPLAFASWQQVSFFLGASAEEALPTENARVQRASTRMRTIFICSGLRLLMVPLIAESKVISKTQFTRQVFVVEVKNPQIRLA
jgi:hypothetical protein